MFTSILGLIIVWCSGRIFHSEANVFSCNFESNSFCGIENSSPVDPIPPLINFTIETVETITFKDLGPYSGDSFLYWSRPADSPHTESNGRVHTPRYYQIDGEKMCLQFQYYLNSTGTNNGTWFDVSVGGCYAASLFFIEQDYSHGWETITVPLHDRGNCSVSLYFTVNQLTSSRVALALDNLIMDWCNTLVETTTTRIPNRTSKFTCHVFLHVILFIFILFN